MKVSLALTFALALLLSCNIFKLLPPETESNPVGKKLDEKFANIIT